MKTFQIIFRVGQTRDIEADECVRGEAKVEFFVEGDPVLYLDKDSVVSVEEVSNS
jgi:hypothetical protein